jgi:hypothetical protein
LLLLLLGRLATMDVPQIGWLWNVKLLHSSLAIRSKAAVKGERAAVVFGLPQITHLQLGE